MRDSAVLVADHNNLGNTNWPGVGNINVNPLFVNPAQRDYRLPTNSPCLGVGRNGGDMGANFTIPLGSVIAPSHPFIERIAHQGQDVIIRFWVDSEKTYTLLAGPTVTGPWSKLGDAFPTTNPRPVSMTNAVPAGGNRFYRLVSPAQP